MARVKFIKSEEPNILALKTAGTVTEGALYVATDTGTLWLGTSSTSLLQIKDNIDTNTTYSAGTGIDLSGTTFSNSGVRSVSTGTSNGTISVNTNGTTSSVSVKGLGSAAYTASSAYAASSHTHSYAGSSSVGGSANSAVKLDSSAGSAATPVYFSNGKPTACTYSLNKTVPSDAVFTDTDTHYSSKTIVNSAATSTANTTAAVGNGSVYLNHVENGSVTSSHKISGSGATTVTADSSGNISVSSTNTVYDVATTSSNGLMTSDMVTKLNGITAGANKYSLPSATSSTLGGVKIGSNITVASGTISLTKANVTSALGYTPPTADTNTHYASKNVVGSTTAITNTTSALTNGNVYLNSVENSAVTSSHKISGSGATTVTTDTSGNIIVSSTNTVYTHPTTSGNKHIPSGGSSGQVLKWSADGTAAWGTDNNTTYSAGTGISLSGTTFSNSGVRAVSTGTSNGTISVNTNGTTADVSVKGLGSAAYTASTAYAAASHTHSYVPLSGGTITGSISRAGGGSWIKGRESAAVKGTATTSTAFNVVASQKTPSGSWNIGNLGSEESLSFSYDTDTDYNANTNNATVIKLPMTKGGTLALTSDIKTYSAGTGLSLSGTTFSNSGVRSISTGTANGTISVNTNGTTTDVSVKGLGSAAYTASTAYAAASHTHSYLPLSGGTVTGVTNFTSGTRVKAFNGTSGTAGYVLVATIGITSTYQNSPIELMFSRRGDSTPTRLSIGFTSANSTDPSLKYFKAFGTTNAAWLYKSATSTWQLYIQKTEGYDLIDVLSLFHPSYDSGISITWGSGQISTMYTSNVTQASFGYNVESAEAASTANFLTTSKAGSATQPVYFSNGVPVACTSYANATVKSATSAANEYSVISGTSQPTDSRCKVWLNTDSDGNLSAVYVKI